MDDTDVDWDRAPLSTNHDMPAPGKRGYEGPGQERELSGGRRKGDDPEDDEHRPIKAAKTGQNSHTKQGLGKPTGGIIGMATTNTPGVPTSKRRRTQGIMSMPHKRTHLLKPDTIYINKNG